MRITEQRKDLDCFLASLSMFLEKPYEDLCSTQPKVTQDIYRYGTYEGECIPFAKLWGAKLRKRRGIPNRKSIIILENHSGGLHAVYFDGVRVLDPSNYTYLATTKEYLQRSLYYFY